MKMISDAEWSQTGFTTHELVMLKDAYKAITYTGLWSWFAGYVPPEGEGFIFTTHPNMKRIEEAMEYGDHSGFSYAWTMRQMEHIAKGGWENYLMLRNRHIKFDRTRTPLEEAAVVSARTLAQNISPLDVAEALRNVPGFEGQADAMKDFSEGNLTYAQMRDLCG